MIEPRVAYHLREVIGCGEEFLAMPCESLRQRLNAALARAIRAIDQIKEEDDPCHRKKSSRPPIQS